VHLIPSSRIRRSRHGVCCTFGALAGRRRDFRYLSLRTTGPGSQIDSLATATVSLGRSPGRSGDGPARILVRFPAEWGEKHDRALAEHMPRPLSSYRAREPLVWDFVTMLLQPGHSRTLIESAAAALVWTVLQAEEEFAAQPPGKVRSPRQSRPHRGP
jgi:hypothetical protein